MRRLLLTVPALLALTACNDAPPPQSLLQQQVKVSFPPGAVINVIRVDALDSLPLREAALVAPDGTATAASFLNVDATPQRMNGETTAGDPWRNSLLGNNGVPPFPNSSTLNPSPTSRERLLLMVSRAEIPLPDPVVYRRDWSKYVVRVSFDQGGGQLDTRDIPAPVPPPD
jgi:hypothetical protein